VPGNAEAKVSSLWITSRIIPSVPGLSEGFHVFSSADGFGIHKNKICVLCSCVWELLVLDKETERLVSEVKKELRALRAKVEQREDPRLLKTYRKMQSTLD